MSQFVETPTKTFTAGEALASNRFVKHASGAVVYADATDKPIGITENDCASGDPIAVRLLSAQGTVKVQTSAAVATEVNVYGTNDGKIDDADPGSGVVVGRSLEAAASGAMCEILIKPDCGF